MAVAGVVSTFVRKGEDEGGGVFLESRVPSLL